MAKYSKEQRRCAVELYVRYECCAADVIRELGYPSREALRVVPELLRTLVFARPCGGDQFAAGTVSPSLDMSR